MGKQHRYTKEEEQYIASSSLTAEQMAEQLGVNVVALRSHMRYMRETGRLESRCRHFTEREDDILADSDLSIKELCEILGRSKFSVMRRLTWLRKHGYQVRRKKQCARGPVPKSKEPKVLQVPRFTKEERNFICTTTQPLCDIAVTLGRTYSSIAHQVFTLRQRGMNVVEKNRKEYTLKTHNKYTSKQI